MVPPLAADRILPENINIVGHLHFECPHHKQELNSSKFPPLSRLLLHVSGMRDISKTNWDFERPSKIKENCVRTVNLPVHEHIFWIFLNKNTNPYIYTPASYTSSS